MAYRWFGFAASVPLSTMPSSVHFDVLVTGPAAGEVRRWHIAIVIGERYQQPDHRTSPPRQSSGTPSNAAWEALQDAYDLHVHVAPDVIARRIDDLDLAKEFLAKGLRGFILKSHYFPTANVRRL